VWKVRETDIGEGRRVYFIPLRVLTPSCIDRQRDYRDRRRVSDQVVLGS
jgi:hypothetical protein